MKFSVGYQLFADDKFVDYIIANRSKINEVYFAWGDIPNGRNIQSDAVGFEPYGAIEKQKKDLKRIAEAGISTNVLFNGNCYGKHSQSRSFFNKIGDTYDYLRDNYSTTAVTTTSLLIAKFIRNNFAGTDVRASVNIGVATENAAEYVFSYFDSFYAARELNRNYDQLLLMRKKCSQNGKKLYGLANSGCFAFCPARTFHDNLVAHEQEISEMDNGYEFHGICSEYFEQQQNRDKLISGLSYIRPEDVHLYEDVYDGLKLATRVNFNPINVCSAYFANKYSGSITDLLEPNHSRFLYPAILDNGLFPESFGEQVKNCKYNCSQCGYCSEVFRRALVVLDIGISSEDI